MGTALDLPIATTSLPTTTHRVRWGEHEAMMKVLRRNPPLHPRNPRYRACEFRVEGRYSLFERIVNVFRERGLIDPPPPEYKWAVVTVAYQAEDDPRNEFARL